MRWIQPRYYRKNGFLIGFLRIANPVINIKKKTLEGKTYNDLDITQQLIITVINENDKVTQQIKT